MRYLEAASVLNNLKDQVLQEIPNEFQPEDFSGFCNPLDSRQPACSDVDSTRGLEFW